MEWKALLIIVKEVDAFLDKIAYKGTLTPKEIIDAETAIKTFPSDISSVTSGNATMVFPDKPIFINKLTKIAYTNSAISSGDVWPDSVNLYDAIKLQKDKWDWGQYDSVFVVHPLQGGGWGICNPEGNRGATYATINAKKGWLLACSAEVFLHEWLHGACGFFKQMGYNIPQKLDTSVIPNVLRRDADCAGVFGYTQLSLCWKPYYVALMTGKVVDKTNYNVDMGGIPLDAWKMGSLKNPNNFIGFSQSLTGYNKDSFKRKYSTYSGVPKGNVHKWATGFIQDFAGKDGHFTIMQGEGNKYPSAYIVKPPIWKKFVENGGAGGLGYPINDLHAWGSGGNIQDFETKDGWHSGIMNKSGTNDWFIVKGNIWRAYVRTEGNGATSYLGYPIGNEFVWKNPDNNRTYWVQYFDGGWCWSSTDTPQKYGNNKQWGTRAIPDFN